jgi:hypothetical protein
MQTVVELDSYLRDAKHAGMSDEECQDVVDLIAGDPTVGTPIAGGARKVRVAGRGKGKSGGYRVVFFYSNPNIPAFLITVFGKGEKDNLTQAEKNALATLTNHLRDSYRNRK